MKTDPEGELGRTLAAILRADARGAAHARPIDRLVEDLRGRGIAVERRDVERTLAAMAHAGLPLGATCAREEGKMGVFWFQTEADARVAFKNIERRFKPLAIRRRRCLDWIARLHRGGRLTDGTGAVEVEVGRDGRIERMPADAAGNAMLFDMAGQTAKGGG